MQKMQESRVVSGGGGDRGDREWASEK